MSLGQELQEARKKKRMSTSEVAAATRMKVQIVEDLEREDFSRIAAPVYGKGFIKLFAEQVGLNPKPLVAEYVARFVNNDNMTLRPEPLPPPEPGPELAGENAPPGDALGTEDEHDLFSRTSRANRRGDQSLFHSTKAPGKPRLSFKPIVDAASRGVQNITGRLSNVFARPDSPPLEDDRSEEARLERALPIPLLKIVSVSIGLLFVLILMASGIRRCVRGNGEEQFAAPPPPEEVRLAVEPPEPYID